MNKMKFYTDNSLNHTMSCFGGQLSLEYPYKLYIDVTQDCNLNCKMCRENVQMTDKTMPFDLFCRLIDETSPFVRSYSLFNWGEPLILKDIRERIDYVCAKKRPDCEMDISTNGMLLSDDMIEFLHSRNTNVIVSFDGADKITFENIRRGANFEFICERIKSLSKMYSGSDLLHSPEIYTSIQKDNQHQLLLIVKLAYSLGIKRVGYGLVTAPIDCTADTNDDLRHEIESTAEFIDSHGMLNSLYPTKVGDYMWWGGKFVHKGNFIVDTSCNAPFTNASIAYNGDVYLCCNGGDVAGNVSDKNFKDIWRSERYNELREIVNSEADMPYRCRECTWVNR